MDTVEIRFRMVKDQHLEDAGDLGRLEKALCAVPLPIPVSRQIVLQECPRARRAATLAASTATLGRPILLPWPSHS